MQRYQDSVLTQNASGVTVVGVGLTVMVYNAGTVVPATIYLDNGVTLIDQLVTPILTDVNGRFEFYAANGRYDVTISGATITTITVPDILLEDLALFFGGNYADNLGTVDALIVSYPNAVTSVLTDGYPIDVDTSIVGTNTGAATITPTIKGVLQATAQIMKFNGVRSLVSLVAGDMPAVAQLRYSIATGVWVLINPTEGEFITSTTVPTAVALATTAVTTLASITLPVGDWDVTGTVTFAPAATTNITALLEGSSLVTNTLGAVGTYNLNYQAGVVLGAVLLTRSMPARRMKITAPTVVYLVGSAAFTVSTCTAGGTINAHRIAQ